ncbi:MAG: MFS transporter, partial [Thiohalocapsa sp.]
MASVEGTIAEAKTRIADALGGPARTQVILVLGGILGLDTADKATVSAVSDQLKAAFHLSNTDIGLLLAAVSFVGAVATLPMGVLADRMRRRIVLLAAVGCWAVAMLASAAATSFLFLLLTRLALGVVTAAAWPCIASLTGDFFPARERASVFGLILSGELVGAGIGFFVAGEVSTLLGWRWAFAAMALPPLVLAWTIWRYLPEPARGEQSWLRVGEEDADAASRPDNGQSSGDNEADKSKVRRVMRQANVRPHPELVVHEDPTGWGWWRTMRYLLSLPTYGLLIAASTLAYFFFSGARAFAMIYFTEHYGLSRGLVSALVLVVGGGTIAGLVAGGRLSEWLLDKGRINARINVPAAALFASIPLLGIGIWTRSVWLGLLLLTLGSGTLAAALAPLDAARLDIVHSRLWGRGEAGRMALRSLFEGGAPLLFGALS